MESLRCVLLSGGFSRRMGRDKALLPHLQGGTWLEHTLRRLAQLEAPISLLSSHPSHLALAQALSAELQKSSPRRDQPAPITPLAEPPPWEGPLLALHRMVEKYPQVPLLLCPVDMPGLNLEVLLLLVAAAQREPTTIHLAHDGQGLQPLLGVYPSNSAMRKHLAAAVAGGERRLQTWLASQPCQAVLLDGHAIRNLNRATEL